MAQLVVQRLLNQQLLSPQYGTPAEVVAHMGAMQAQEYRMMRWAVAMRTQKPSAQAFADDYNTGRIVRLHLLRGTWQLVAKADYWWMLDLFAERSKKVINGWMKSNNISISQQEYNSIRTILIETAQGRSNTTKEDFAQALTVHGKTMDDHRLSYHIRMAELDGVLCSGDLLPMKMTYCLSAEKMGPQTFRDPDESLHDIAKRYFQSHAPATIEDFVWWSGLTKSECKKGMASLGDQLISIRHADTNFYLLDSCRTQGILRNNLILLPSYDEYLIGYKSRYLVLDKKYTHLAHTRNGIFFPVVLHNGIAVGNWKPFEKTLETKFFEPSSISAEKAWLQYQKYLNS